MSDNLKDLAQLSKMEDELSLGGEGEGTAKTVLRKSELQVMRRMADRIPINNGERTRAVELTMQVIDGDYSPGHKLTALRVFATFEKLNVEEMKMYIAAKMVSQRITTPAQIQTPIVNVNVAVSVQGILDEYADVISSGAIQAKPAQVNGTGKSIHSAETNGKAS